MSSSIEIKGLSFEYPDGAKALDGINLEIAKGESVAIVGPSGAGKTTLMLSLVGFLAPSAGAITVEGIDVHDKNLKQIREHVGLIFQNPDDQLFMPTLYDDVAFGLLNRGVTGDDLDTRVKKAIVDNGLAGLENKFPGHLSGGQKRLASLAAVMVMSPGVLLLDEPSSNLDPKSRRQLIEKLVALDNTRIVASHDLEMVIETCSRVVVLDGGKIVEDGKPRDILSQSETMKRHSLEVPHSLQHHARDHH